MSISLLETVQQNLGYAPLHKIDPNTQDTAWDKTPMENRFGQAALPAVLTAMYLFVQADECAAEILKDDPADNWVDRIFVDNTRPAIQIIADYSGQSVEETVKRLTVIANEAARVTKAHLPTDAGIKDVKLFFTNQRNNILLYLPVALHMGELLHNNTLDDNVNKMEGPISSLMKIIGGAFTNPVTEKEVRLPEDKY